jgi:alginate O-acetyltransferase complex protein AlgJ
MRDLSELAAAAECSANEDGEELAVFARRDPGQDSHLRVLVPGVSSARDPLVASMKQAHPEDARFNIRLPAHELSAEHRLLDLWSDLPERERARVTCVIGRSASHLLRFEDRPATAFAFLGRPSASRAAPPNAQARALLAATHPDTWMLALDTGPQVDADRWRHRLATVAAEGWVLAVTELPLPGFELLKLELGIGHALKPKAMFSVRPATRPTGQDEHEQLMDWLDAELYARTLESFEDGAILDEREPWPETVWRRARDASVGRRLRRVEGELRRRGPASLATSTWLQSSDSAQAEAGLEPKVLRGKDGWLFLANDSTNSMEQITGERTLSRQELDSWERGMRERLDLSESLGAGFAMLLGPSPQVVHEELLPEGIRIAQERPAVQALRRLESMERKPTMLYPLPQLRSAYPTIPAFSKTDSHWNDLGAFLAYEALMTAVGDVVESRRVGRDSLWLHETVYIGDLGSKLRPERASIFLRASFDEASARLVEDNTVRNHGRFAAYECPAAPPTSCVLFGDSWAYALLPLLAESFRRLTFYHRVNVVDAKPMHQERPDLVLVVLNERFLTVVPEDAAAVPFEQVVAKKLAGGHVVPPVGRPKTRADYLHSVRIDRDLPRDQGFRLAPVLSRPATREPARTIR